MAVRSLTALALLALLAWLVGAAGWLDLTGGESWAAFGVAVGSLGVARIARGAP